MDEAKRQLQLFELRENVGQFKVPVPFLNGHYAPYLWPTKGPHAIEALNVLQELDGKGPQDQKVIAAIQSFGTGKTKLAVSLAEKVVVVPIPIVGPTWECLKDRLIDMLRKFSGQTLHDVVTFHQSCYRVVLNWVWAHLISWYLTHSNVASNVWTAHAIKRNTLVALIRSLFLNFDEGQKCVVENHIYQSKTRLILFYDEVQQFSIQEFVGVPLCKDERREEKFVFADWKKRQGRFGGTTLLYFLGEVCISFFNSVRCPGQILASTQFSVWKELLTETVSPFSRQQIVQISTFYRFTPDEVKATLAEYVDYEWKPEVFVTWRGRPMYFYDYFLKELTEQAPDVAQDKAFKECLHFCSTQLERFGSSRVLVANKTSEQRLVELLYAFYVCHGVLKVPKEELDLLNEGFAFIASTDSEQDGFKCVFEDNFFLSAFKEYFKGKLEDRLFQYLAKLLMDSKVAIQTSLLSGHLVEKALALAYSSKRLIPDSFGVVPSNGVISGAVEDWPLQSSEPRLLMDIARDVAFFPSPAAGPDLWTACDTNNGPVFVAVQSKCYNKHVTPKLMEVALDSLSPWFMFAVRDRKKDSFGSVLTTEGRLWRELLIERAHQFERFIRVVFSACGFAAPLWYEVEEYNRTPVGRSRPIVLVESSEKLFNKVFHKAITAYSYGSKHDGLSDGQLERQLVFVDRNDVLRDRKMWTLPRLQSECRFRGLETSGSKEVILDRLVDHLKDKDFRAKLILKYDAVISSTPGIAHRDVPPSFGEEELLESAKRERSESQGDVEDVPCDPRSEPSFKHCLDTCIIRPWKDEEMQSMKFSPFDNVPSRQNEEWVSVFEVDDELAARTIFRGLARCNEKVEMYRKRPAKFVVISTYKIDLSEEKRRKL